MSCPLVINTTNKENKTDFCAHVHDSTVGHSQQNQQSL